MRAKLQAPNPFQVPKCWSLRHRSSRSTEVQASTSHSERTVRVVIPSNIEMPYTRSHRTTSWSTITLCEAPPLNTSEMEPDSHLWRGSESATAFQVQSCWCGKRLGFPTPLDISSASAEHIVCNLSSYKAATKQLQSSCKAATRDWRALPAAFSFSTSAAAFAVVLLPAS